MCLIVLAHRAIRGVPLVLAANRDELLARPATAMTELRRAGPRVLGGRDHEAGGTWLAVARTGLVVALTNSPGGRVRGRRSRGELPLALIGGGRRGPATAAAAATRASRIDPTEFSPCWLIGADRDTAFFADLTGEVARVHALEPGVHVLENSAIEPRSAKAAFVRDTALKVFKDHRGPDRVDATFELLASHESAPGDQTGRPAELLAPCVHFGIYGTRSSNVVEVAQRQTPTIHYTDGRPCEAERQTIRF